MTDGVWSTLLCSGELTRRPARGRPHSLVWVFSTGPVGKRCRATLTSGAELVAALLLSLCSGATRRLSTSMRTTGIAMLTVVAIAFVVRKRQSAMVVTIWLRSHADAHCADLSFAR